MEKAVRMGSAQAALNRMRERRCEMKVAFTSSASELMFLMFCAPNKEWDRADQYQGDGYAEKRELAALSRMVEEKLLGPKNMTQPERMRAVIKAVEKMLESPAPRDEAEEIDQHNQRNQAIKFIVESISRKFIEATVGIKSSYIERIKDVTRHYAKKKSKTILAVHWSDLEEALKGQPTASADDVLEDDDSDRGS